MILNCYLLFLLIVDIVEIDQEIIDTVLKNNHIVSHFDNLFLHHDDSFALSLGFFGLSKIPVNQFQFFETVGVEFYKGVFSTGGVGVVFLPVFLETFDMSLHPRKQSEFLHDQIGAFFFSALFHFLVQNMALQNSQDEKRGSFLGIGLHIQLDHLVVDSQLTDAQLGGVGERNDH